MFRGFQKNHLRVPIFFSIFDQKFSNALFKFQSLDAYLFNNLRAEFLVNTGATIFFKYKKNVNIGFLDFYKFARTYPRYFFNFLSLKNMSVVGLCSKYLYSYCTKATRPYNFTLFFKFPKFFISSNKKFGASTRHYIRGYRWVHNWSIKFIWAPGNKNRYEYYSFKNNTYLNYPFFTRVEVDLAMKSSLSGVIFPSFLFGFLFVYDLDRVF